MGIARTYCEDNCYYLIQQIGGMSLYDKSKAVVDFCDKETKLFEKELDKAILDILEKNGINVQNTTKSVLKVAFDMLNAKGKKIVITDLYKNRKSCDDEDTYYLVAETKNHFTIMLETSIVNGTKLEILQCGVCVEEKEL